MGLLTDRVCQQYQHLLIIVYCFHIYFFNFYSRYIPPNNFNWLYYVIRSSFHRLHSFLFFPLVFRFLLSMFIFYLPPYPPYPASPPSSSHSLKMFRVVFSELDEVILLLLQLFGKEISKRTLHRPSAQISCIGQDQEH